MKKILMIDPHFPVARKSVNHQDILPIGLLKIGSYLTAQGCDVRLQRLCESRDPISDFYPNEIKVTSSFTYYSKYVKDAVDWARENYPNVPVEVGGIFASLQPKLCEEVTCCDSVHVGLYEKAEEYQPMYSLLTEEPNYQIIHTTRGCTRNCKPCGVNCIEPQLSFESSIKDKIFKRKIVFYDNNLLANPHIEDILRELILLKRQRKILHCESQSGFDGRILRKKPFLGRMLWESGFVYPKIAWDGSVKSWRKRKEEIDILIDSGYRRADTSVFVLTNYEQPYAELEFKRMYCWDWGVQVTPCRFRPLDQLDDNFIGRRKNQTSEDYYIHPNWSDDEIKQYNRSVRRHNMSIRFRSHFYSSDVEHKRISKELHDKVRFMKYTGAVKYLNDAWDPSEFHGVE